MKTQISILILAVTLLLTVAAGCRRADDEGLLAVERAMDSDPYPARALAMLDSIEAAGQAPDRATRAHRALLRAELTIKNHLPLTSDSLLAEARSYYTAHPRSNRLARAWHYTGIWHYLNGRYDTAVKASSEAMRLATAIHDTILIARSYQQMGMLYYITYNFEEAKHNSAQAAHLYGLSGKYLNHLFSLMELADALAANEEYDASVRLLDSLDVMSLNVPEGYKDAYTESLLYPLYYNRDLPRLDTLMRLRTARGIATTLTDRLATACLDLHAGNIDRAKACLDSADALTVTPNDTVALLMAKMFCSRAAGDYKKALYYDIEASGLTDRVAAETLRSTIEKGRAEYYSEQTRRVTAEAELRKMQFMLAAVTALLLAVVAVMIIQGHRRSRRRAEEALEARMAELQLMLASKHELESRITGANLLHEEREKIHAMKYEELRNKMIAMLHERMADINEACGIYQGVKDSGKITPIMMERLKKVIDKNFSENELDRFYHQIDALYENRLSLFISSFPEVSDSIILTYALCCTSLSPQAMSVILGISQSNFYTRRRRLRYKIETSTVLNKKILLVPFDEPRQAKI